MSSARIVRRIALASLIFAACASPTSRPTARLVDFGIVRLVGPLQKHADPNTAVGYTTSAPGRSVFEKKTTEIPALQGITFGIRYRIEGISPRKPVTVEEIIRHPPITRPDGKVIREERTRNEAAPLDGVVDQKFLYLLREPYELVAGDWSLVVAVDGRKTIEQHFNVISQK
jgi:hypothetical protein